jgi:hypothetical protein
MRASISFETWIELQEYRYIDNSSQKFDIRCLAKKQFFLETEVKERKPYK